MVQSDDVSDRSVTRTLHNRVVRYSAIGIFSISSTIAAVSFLPLYHQQRQQQELGLTNLAETRAAVVDLYLQNTRAIAQQITSRTGIRQMLEDYNRQEISLTNLQVFTAEKLLEAMNTAEDITAISRYDANGQLVVQVGQPSDPSLDTLGHPPGEIQVDLQRLANSSQSTMTVTAPIYDPVSGAVIGADVVQFNGNALQAILRDRNGLGKTGQAYLSQPLPAAAAVPSLPQPALSAAINRTSAVSSWWRLARQQTPLTTVTMPLEMADSVLVISMARAEVYAPLHRKLTPILLLIAALGTLQTIAVLVLLRPLSDRVLVHSTKLAEINKQLQAACEQSPVSILITDIRGRIQYVNPKFQELTGYTLAEVIGQTPRLMKSGSTPDATYRELWQTIMSGRTWHGELLNRKKNGELFWESVTIAPIKHENGQITHYVGIKEDVTLRRQAQELLQYQAQHDILTGLMNRTYALETLSHKLNQAALKEEQLAVFFIDLNGFKRINDTLGHGVGDHLLVIMAKRLQNCLRDSDLIARLGGDEFLVAIAGPGIAQQAQEVAHKILTAFSQPVSLKENVVQLSGSLGIALYPQDAEKSLDLINRADLAMYAAKQRQSSAGVFFSPEMTAVPVASNRRA